MSRFMEPNHRDNPQLGFWERAERHYKKESVDQMPSLSVIIATCNQAHVLEMTLESLFSQKNVPLEIIIVDAGSTDSTANLLEQHNEKITRIYYSTQHNIPFMINQGVNVARGDYVCFVLPGYEYLNPYCLCQASRTALDNQLPDFVYAADNHIEEALKNYRQLLYESVSELHPSFTLYPFNRSYLKRGFLPTSPICMWFKRTTLIDIGLLDHKYSYTKSIFDLICRLYQQKEVRTATTFWAMSDTTWKEKNFMSFPMLMERWTLVVKYFGWIAGVLWFFRDKPVHIFSWLLNTLNNIFKKEAQ